MKPYEVVSSAAFWAVWAENGGVPTVKHEDYESAMREAQRLARNNRGTRFFVLQAIGHAVIDDVRVALYDDEIPF